MSLMDMAADGDWAVTKKYVGTVSSNRLQKEADLRAKHPGLNEAWERYQILLSLVLTENDK